MGLTDAQVAQKQAAHGKNEITRKKHASHFQILIKILKDPIIIIMSFALLISVMAGVIESDFLECYVILGLILVNVIINFIQELKTIDKLKALEDLNKQLVTVIRSDKKQSILASELVVDDIVVLKIGEIARADYKIISANDLSVDESFLTGESIEVQKQVDEMVYSNSQIKLGYATCIVTQIGLNTKIGQLASEVDDVVVTKSQLEIKIFQITKLLLVIAFATSFLILILSLINGFTLLETLSLTISILIATVPEGLLTVLTIVLTFMSAKLGANNALLKKVDLIETLGEVDFVCSDKTGTITQNIMQVSEHKYYEPELLDLLSVIDNLTPTSKAIYQFLNVDTVKVKVIEHTPFSSQKKSQSYIVEHLGEQYQVIIGAPEFVFADLSPFEPQMSKQMDMGNRIIVVGFKKVTDLNLKPLAMFAILDPPKQSAIIAIKQMHQSNIKVVMITGDSLKTATSIAKATNIVQGPDDLCITGDELNQLSDIEFEKIVKNIRVYARTQPQDKHRIVLTLQKLGHIVAMTGDGTNDSIALKQANVGIAMGINGTDISKESSDLILLDDNFATINVAIAGGRLVFDNLQKFIRQMLTSNAAHTGSILFVLLFGLFTDSIVLPMTSILILWVNIISDAIPCLALGLDVAEDDLLKRPPIKTSDKIVTNSMIYEILIRGFGIGFLVFISFSYLLNQGVDLSTARTFSFVVLSFGQLIHIFDARSFTTIYYKNPFSNKLLLINVGISMFLNLLIIYSPLNILFGLTPLSFTYLITAILIGASATFVLSAIKLLFLKFIKTN